LKIVCWKKKGRLQGKRKGNRRPNNRKIKLPLEKKKKKLTEGKKKTTFSPSSEKQRPNPFSRKRGGGAPKKKDFPKMEKKGKLSWKDQIDEKKRRGHLFRMPLGGPRQFASISRHKKEILSGGEERKFRLLGKRKNGSRRPRGCKKKKRAASLQLAV